MGKALQTPDHLENEAPASTDLAQQNPITCEICIEPILLPNKRFENNNLCSHPFCETCIIKYIQAKLEDNVAKIPCPAMHCTHLLHTLSCRTILPPHLLVKWCDVLCEEFVLGSDICYCPNRGCSVLVINECGGRNLKKSKCPNCKNFFCFKCKLPWHAGFNCEERRELTEPNDVAFAVLVEKNKWKRCPHCRHFVQRSSGCDKITCRCGMIFCYNCGRKAHQYACIRSPDEDEVNDFVDNHRTIRLILLFLLFISFMIFFEIVVAPFIVKVWEKNK